MESSLSDTKILVALSVGVFMFFLYCVTKILRKDPQENDTKVRETVVSHNKKDVAKTAKKKTGTWSTQNQNFTSTWQVAAMKGHTGAVLDIDYSTNGKYIASCGEEETSCSSGSSSSGSECGSIKEGGDDDTTPPLLGQPMPTTSSKGLSRRQRKNRRRDYAMTLPPPSPPSSHQQQPMKSSQQFEPLMEYKKLNVSESQFFTLLDSHLLTPEQMFVMGFPLPDPNYKNRVVFFNSNVFANNRAPPAFDVNAREFVPRDPETSSSSSDDSETSEVEAEITVRREKAGADSSERACARCGSGFFMTRTDYLTQERCFYHWGKVRANKGRYEYTCCGERAGHSGCTTSKLHVWNGSESGLNFPANFVRTHNRRTTSPGGHFGVYALDCEMCYTITGLEVTKVTVVSMDGKLVYDTLVKPVNEIIDYNTRFSGITAKDFSKSNVMSVKTLKQVQNDLRGFISAKTVLIGHGLNNDLCALKMVHTNVVDTSMSFPHNNGFPYRRSLKALMHDFLNKNIQEHSTGHSSYEDACACMELMLMRVRTEYKGFV